MGSQLTLASWSRAIASQTSRAMVVFPAPGWPVRNTCRVLTIAVDRSLDRHTRSAPSPFASSTEAKSNPVLKSTAGIFPARNDKYFWSSRGNEQQGERRIDNQIQMRVKFDYYCSCWSCFLTLTFRMRWHRSWRCFSNSSLALAQTQYKSHIKRKKAGQSSDKRKRQGQTMFSSFIFQSFGRVYRQSSGLFHFLERMRGRADEKKGVR